MGLDDNAAFCFSNTESDAETKTGLTLQISPSTSSTKAKRMGGVEGQGKELGQEWWIRKDQGAPHGGESKVGGMDPEDRNAQSSPTSPRSSSRHRVRLPRSLALSSPPLTPSP